MAEHSRNSLLQGRPAASQGCGLQGQRRPVGPAGRGLPALQFNADQAGQNGVRSVSAGSHPGGKLLDLVTA